MKKILILLLSAVMVFSLAACGGGDAPDQEKEEAKTEESAESEVPGIKGSQAYDVVVSLKDKGIPEAESVSTSDGYQFDSVTSEYSYSITTNKHHEIMSATFNVLSEDNGFLQYCASLPYDTATPEEASAWVTENIGTEATAEFGDAVYTLSVGNQGPYLTIEDPDFQEYVFNQLDSE